jgi:diaminopimelate decarboxylase
MGENMSLSFAKERNSSFFVFSERRLERNFFELSSAIREQCEGFNVCYSYKTNYIPSIVSRFHQLGALAEVVSGVELRLAQRLGVSGENIVFNGPFKDFDSLKRAVDIGCLINIDSPEELSMLERLLRFPPIRKPRIGIRVMLKQDAEIVSRFGIDPYSTAFSDIVRRVVQLNGGELASLHCHLPSRGLTHWESRIRQMKAILRALEGVSIRSINLGGGMAGRMPRSMYDQLGGHPPSFSDYAKILGEFINSYRMSNKSSTVLMVEPGTALVADAGYYFCRVISVKNSSSSPFVFVAGSAQCIGSIGSSISYRVRVQHEKGYASQRSSVKGARIVGYTCIERDVLHHCFSGRVAVGDFLCFTNAGSYSVVMKPQFIQLAPPVYLLCANGELRIVRREESLDELTSTYYIPENARDCCN